MKAGTKFVLLIPLLGGLLLVAGCRMDRDYSLMSGSYQSAHTRAAYYLDLRIYKEGNVVPKFYLGSATLLKGDYRALMQMDNPTFSEEAIMEVLDENKKRMAEYELHFWDRPDDDDQIVDVLVRRGAKARYLTVDNIVIPYDRRIAWLKLKTRYIRFNHDAIEREIHKFNPLDDSRVY